MAPAAHAQAKVGACWGCRCRQLARRHNAPSQGALAIALRTLPAFLRLTRTGAGASRPLEPLGPGTTPLRRQPRQ